MRVELDIWRQNGPDAKGHFEHHVVEDAEPEWSLLELLDRLNDQIVENDGDPIVFESDCREGVCGCCGFMVNGKPHGPLPNTPACRQHLRAFPHITHFKIEPFRSAAFPVIRDLAIDRTSMDHLIQAGGTVDVMTGTAPAVWIVVSSWALEVDRRLDDLQEGSLPSGEVRQSSDLMPPDCSVPRGKIPRATTKTHATK